MKDVCPLNFSHNDKATFERMYGSAQDKANVFAVENYHRAANDFLNIPKAWQYYKISYWKMQ